MKYNITIKQQLIVSGEVEADSLKDARFKAHETLLPDSDSMIRGLPTGARFELMCSSFLPSTEDFDVDKTFSSVSEAVEYIKKQVDPFECLFRLLKHRSYWGDHVFASEVLAASGDIIEAQSGDGYLP